MIRIEGELVLGHKGGGVEVPFDPADRWGPPVQLRKGRRGHRVTATVRGHTFPTEIVPRMKRFWLFLDDAAIATLGVDSGDRIVADVAPAPSVTDGVGR